MHTSMEMVPNKSLIIGETCGVKRYLAIKEIDIENFILFIMLG